VKYLVDTNGWIGFLEGRTDFGPEAKRSMLAEPGECGVSLAGIWEAAIKVGIGKLKLPYDLETDLPRILEENGFEVIPIAFADAVAVRGLQGVHGDPFDRIQIVQARRLGLSVISRDSVFERYGLARVW
jgi:PIN domain nuclease of toxin-antitoxin system